MKRMMLATAALVLVSGAIRADWGGPVPPTPSQSGMKMPQIGGPNTLLGAGGPYNGVEADRYGLNPRLKRIFRIGSHREAPVVPPSYYWPMMGYNQNGPAYNPGGYPPGAYGQPQGTLVFPHQPFARSPRDWFMLEHNR